MSNTIEDLMKTAAAANPGTGATAEETWTQLFERKLIANSIPFEPTGPNQVQAHNDIYFGADYLGDYEGLVRNVDRDVYMGFNQKPIDLPFQEFEMGFKLRLAFMPTGEPIIIADAIHANDGTHPQSGQPKRRMNDEGNWVDAGPAIATDGTPFKSVSTTVGLISVDDDMLDEHGDISNWWKKMQSAYFRYSELVDGRPWIIDREQYEAERSTRGQADYNAFLKSTGLGSPVVQAKPKRKVKLKAATIAEKQAAEEMDLICKSGKIVTSRKAR